MKFRIKVVIAWFLNIFGITDMMLSRLNKKLGNNYIRVINYHDTTRENASNFEKQLKWYQKHFENVDYRQFEMYMENRNVNREKPGIMITFDDGMQGNYKIALPILEKYGFTGYFMCSSYLIGKEKYMNYDELREMIKRGHVIGDHTATHHRMLINDSEEKLQYEIIESKKHLEEETNVPIQIFCWCGGEEIHYTKNAYEMIKKAGYKYAFMTNSAPVTKNTNALHIQRINVEDGWKEHLMKLQVCGFMDKHFEKKRYRVDDMLIKD